MIPLIVLSVLTALLGLTAVTTATLGVGLMTLACLFAVLARIRQAHVHHRELHPAKSYDPATDRFRQPVKADALTLQQEEAR